MSQWIPIRHRPHGPGNEEEENENRNSQSGNGQNEGQQKNNENRRRVLGDLNRNSSSHPETEGDGNRIRQNGGRPELLRNGQDRNQQPGIEDDDGFERSPSPPPMENRHGRERERQRSRCATRAPAFGSRNERHPSIPPPMENRHGRERDRQPLPVFDRAPDPQPVRNEQDRERRSPSPGAHIVRRFHVEETHQERKDRLEAWIHRYRQTQKTQFFIAVFNEMRVLYGFPDFIFPQPPLPFNTKKVESCLRFAMFMVFSPDAPTCPSCILKHGFDDDCFDLANEYKSYVIMLHNANLPSGQMHRKKCIMCFARPSIFHQNVEEHEVCRVCLRIEDIYGNPL